MPMYLFQGKYTPESFGKLIANPQDRTKIVSKLAKDAGGKLHHLFYAFGEHDIVALMEFPDNVSVGAVTMTVAAGGALSGGQTTALLTTEEFVAALKKAGDLGSSYKKPS